MQQSLVETLDGLRLMSSIQSPLCPCVILHRRTYEAAHSHDSDAQDSPPHLAPPSSTERREQKYENTDSASLGESSKRVKSKDATRSKGHRY